ncbi:hypothetical protein IWW38_004037, partial [Coemansia aciculifera]
AARDPNGEWWELVDEETGVPYYYNSTTGATEWDPPDCATIVPFHALLTSSVGKRLSIVVSNRGSMAFTSEHVDMLTRKASRASLRSATDGHVSRKNSIAVSGSRHRRMTSAVVIEPVCAELEQSAMPDGASSPADSAQSLGDCDSGRRSSLTDTQHRLESGTRAAASPESKEQHRLSTQRHS